jgi:hypothetical protein
MPFPFACSIMNFLFNTPLLLLLLLLLLHSDTLRSAFFEQTGSLHPQFIVGTSAVNGK